MRLAAALASSLCLAGCSATIAERSVAFTGGSALQDYAMPVTSMQARKFEGVIHQRYDFSCGSAALATLLRYHYGYATDEEQAFRGMWAEGDRVQIRRLGFSLLDMKRWLASRGLAADGYKVTLDQIEKTGVPGLALVRIKDYRHFVVVKGVRGQEVLLGDPSTGLGVVTRAAFEQSWNGIIFVINGQAERARTHFNQPVAWAAFARAPIGARLGDPQSLQALALTAPFQGDF